MADLYQFNFEMDEARKAELQENFGGNYFREQYYNDAAVTKLENFEKDHVNLVELQEKIAAEQKICDADENYPKQHLNELEKQYQESFANSFAAENNSPQRIANLIKTYQEVQKLDNPKLNNQFEFLSSFSENIKDGNYQEIDGRNVSRLLLKTGQDGKPRLLMAMRNLGGTGLDFTIENDRSIVFAKDAKLTRQQVQELARFFADNGMSINDFTNLADINVFDENGEKSGGFEQIFKEESQKYAQEQAKEAELGGMDAPASETQFEPAMPSFGEYSDYLTPKNKPLNVNLKAMKKSVRDRAGIMGYGPRQLKSMRMPDGSYCICGYADSNAMIDDMKMDKDGHIKHTKDWAIKMYPTVPPSASMYLRPGAEFKASHAKMVLGLAKVSGCSYFTMPPTSEVGGSVHKAFWEASGDQLVCPRLKRTPDDDGIPGFGNDHLQVILKAIKDKGANDQNDVLLFKMRLVEEINAQEAYQQKYENKKIESNLNTARACLQGDIKFGKFNSSYKGILEKYINDKMQNGGTTADLAAAYIAMGEVLKAIDSGHDSNGNPINYDYLDRKGTNAEMLQNLLGAEMTRAQKQVNDGIVKHLKAEKGAKDIEQDDDLENGDSVTKNAWSRAANNFLNETRDMLQKNVVDQLKDGYGESADFKFSITTRTAPYLGPQNDNGRNNDKGQNATVARQAMSRGMDRG